MCCLRHTLPKLTQTGLMTLRGAVIDETLLESTTQHLLPRSQRSRDDSRLSSRARQSIKHKISSRQQLTTIHICEHVLPRRLIRSLAQQTPSTAIEIKCARPRYEIPTSAENMSAPLPKRIIKETERLQNEPVPGISAVPHEENVRYFDVMVEGPGGSCYEGMV